MKRRIAVIGTGTAGLVSAMHLCTWLDDSFQVCSVHNPDKKILGIGESTNGAFVNVLERGTHFSLANVEDLAALDATVKYGSRFLNWRQHAWVNPLLSGNIAIHFNTCRLKDFVFQRLGELWPAQFDVLEADVQEVQNFATHVTLVTDSGSHDFEYAVDCTGTPSSFTGYTLSDCTLVDRCRIHTVQPYEYEPFTDHIATRHGWMFGVPLRGHKTYGYLYNHAITDTQAAEEDMMTVLGAQSLDAGGYDEHYAFRCYYANELISGRVCKNGNKALFFEPLLANSVFLYIYAARLVYDHIISGQETGRCNALFAKAAQQMEDVISYYYKGGSRFDSEFWSASRSRSNARLAKRPEFFDYLRTLADLKKRGVMNSGAAYGFSPHTWQVVDAHMGYHSFDTAPDGG